MPVIILEDLDFEWEKEQINKAIEMWNANLGVPDIAAEFKRSVDETFLLMMHLSREKRIKKRRGYFWGGK